MNDETEQPNIDRGTTGLLAMLETAILRIAFEQDTKRFYSLRSPHIEQALDRNLSPDLNKLFEAAGMVEIAEFAKKFWPDFDENP